MKTEDRKVKETGCTPVRKKNKAGEARGRPSWTSSFVGDPGAKVFCRKRGRAQSQKKRAKKQEPIRPRLANRYRHRGRALQRKKTR